MAAKSSCKHNLMFAALAAALFAAAPAFAQDAPETPEEPANDANATSDRLVDAYADTLFGGDEAAAAGTIAALRTGSDITVTTEVERQATNEDGTPAVDADGNPVMETITVETVVPNGAGPMGWGEVDHSLAMAQALIGNGTYASLDEALLGASTVETVTNEDGTTTTTVAFSGDGILTMRADGMGWGQIARELGFKSLGEVKSGRAFADASARGKSAEHRADPAVARVDKVDRVAKVARPDRPERIAKIDRPVRPERPERPVKPERPGRP